METPRDEPSLQEALQVLSGWDMDIAAVLEPDDAVPKPLQGRPPRKMRRADAERLQLLQEVGQLQQHLASSLPQNATPSTSWLCDAWAEIAARQRKQRVNVQVENHNLREAIESQLRLTQKAATLMDKVKTIDAALGSERPLSMDGYKGPPAAIVDDQLTRLDELAAEAQEVFSSSLFSTPGGHEVRDVAFRSLGQVGLMIELMVSWVLPFSVARVADALWLHTTRMPRTERTICLRDIYTTEDTLVSQFVSEAKTLGTIQLDSIHPSIGSTHGQIATRRGPIGTDGSFLVISTMDVTNLRENGTCKSILQGDGLLQVEPIKTGSGTGDALCRVKWCRRVVGSPPDQSPAAVAEFTQSASSFVSSAMRDKWWRSIDAHIQAIENRLFA